MVIIRDCLRFSCLIIFLATVSVASAQENKSVISLAGQWQFQLDADSVGERQKWYLRDLNQKIKLPGTTDEAGYGTKTSGPDYGILSRAFKYVGPAWYSREIVIPAAWKNQPVELMLERVMWQSKVWVDGKSVGEAHSLSTPHRYNLGILSPGKHKLTICVNNDLIYNIGDKGHAYTEYTQSIWNGIIGEIFLRPVAPVTINEMAVYADSENKKLQLKCDLGNFVSQKTFAIQFNIIEKATGKQVHQIIKKSLLKPNIQFDIPFNFQPKLWDEFNPNLYKLVATFRNGINKIVHNEDFGFRKISTSRSKFLINNMPVFMRGNLDCVHFPLTGYPSPNVKDWERIFKIYKSYGLNHVRFHSWTPPRAAFEAADKVGIYIMTEIIWIDWWMTKAPDDRPDMITKGFPEGLGKNPSADAFTQEEMKRIIKEYGNHPSFVMFCIGNELGNSDFNIMEGWIKKMKAADPRRLYSISTARKIMPVDDFNATHNIPGIGGTYGFGRNATNDDLEKNYGASAIPIMAHEVGQFPVYPLWSEIGKYTGVLKARNLQVCYDLAKAKGMDNEDQRFHKASGAVQQLLYKELIENIFRTPSAAGFQLLSMQDYQGQGEALVGWLDAFYDSKNITTPKDFTMHNAAVVALARFNKYVWTNNESFSAKLQLANYGNEDLQGQMLWKIYGEGGTILGQGQLSTKNYVLGALPDAGAIEVPLKDIKTAGKYSLEISLQNTSIKNRWDFWVYPQSQPVKKTSVLETDQLDSAALKALEQGNSVLFYASGAVKKGLATPIFFKPLFWSHVFFPGQANTTLGASVQHTHPALALFPTDSYTNWNWESISKGSSVILNNFPKTITPIVQPVSDFHINDKLGSLFEVKVGKGKLMVCGYELDTLKQPVARQLRHSLLQYMNSEKFNPSTAVVPDLLKNSFPQIAKAEIKTPLPDAFKNALLYVNAGKNATADGHQDWKASLDETVNKRNAKYEIKKIEGIWRGNGTVGWYGKEVDIKITLPQGVIGEFYVHLYDWNGENREADINLEGRDFKSGPIGKTGKWVRLFVMREDTNDGEVNLKFQSTRGSNVMIDQLVFVEQL